MKATLNVSSVLAKLGAWDKSAAGAAAKRNKIDEYVKEDKRKTDAGSTLVTLDWANEMADELCGLIRNNAAGLPGSVLANVNSIHSAGATYAGGGAIMVEMSFSGDLMRSSLLNNSATAKHNSYYPVNIVAIFEKGYTASAQVYGSWHEMSIASVAHRDGLGFIRKAVDEFNSRYSQYDVHATILGIYA